MSEPCFVCLDSDEHPASKCVENLKRRLVIAVQGDFKKGALIVNLQFEIENLDKELKEVRDLLRKSLVREEELKQKLRGDEQ